MYDVKVLLERNLNPRSSYLTVGKTYEGILWNMHEDSLLLEIRDDVGDPLLVLVGTDCSHIHCDGWKIVEED